jgi:DNA-binding MarR family transcriptional regulator
MAKPGRDEIIEGILKLSDRLFRVLLPTVPQELLQIDVTMSQIKIMFILFINGQIRMSDMAADLQVTLATATGLVDRLVEKGLVVRESQPDDRRVVLCRLSEGGHGMVSGIWESARNNTRNILKTLDTARLRMLTEVLEVMLRLASQKNEAPARP